MIPPAAVNDDLAHPFDVCLLLRAHGEQWWLTTEVIPVLEELEPPCALSYEQLGAAYAYLEVLSIDAARRARETEDAFAALVASPGAADSPLRREARCYHAAVRSERESLRRRVARLMRAATRGGATGPAPPAPGPSPQHQAAAL